MKMNKRMISDLVHVRESQVRLPSDLLSIIEAGFVEVDGCYFLRAFSLKETNARLENFPDRTGFECFINSLHIDDYVGNEYLISACRFAEKLIDVWWKSKFSYMLNVIVVCDEIGALVKCHVIRENESWLAPDLESYEESILVVNSTFHKSISLNQVREQ